MFLSGLQQGGGESRIGAAVTLCSRVTRPPSVPEWPRIGVDEGERRNGREKKG